MNNSPSFDEIGEKFKSEDENSTHERKGVGVGNKIAFLMQIGHLGSFL
jgi:hypothetical protein